ncbi:MAG: amylo-alpha-1,6-glucosidase [Phycisphaerales bacterium]|nr:amylo-alpha-1,6-glucosidase [Phycisphaerales bacterium]
MPTEAADPADEWIRTDGLGGWAMGTLDGINTRRYHALWMAADAPPVQRFVALRAVMDEVALDDGQVFSLTRGRFGPDAQLHPINCADLIETDVSGSGICWRFAIQGAGEVVRTLALNATGLKLQWTAINCTLRLRLLPLTTMRSAHHLQHGPSDDLAVRDEGDVMHVMRGSRQVQFSLAGGRWTDQLPDWWHALRYTEEAARGYDDTEDALAIGQVEAVLSPGQSCMLKGVSARAQTAPDMVPSHCSLEQAADQFIVRRGQAGQSIIAGYPWFADWGRDTMISLPGLLIHRGQLDCAQDVLQTWASAMRNGLLPNRFDDVDGTPHHDTADASLWFILSLCKWIDAGGRDPDLLDAAWQVVDAYLGGTDFGICVRSGLVEAGADGHALTWMDAQHDGIAITPRRGRPIELSALWLESLRRLSALLPERDSVLQREATRTADAFGQFWNEATGCCHDVLGDTPDPSIRPNQVIACAMPSCPLPLTQRRSILRLVEQRLLTSVGLRTLDPSDARYMGTCEGSQQQRDLAYHNGTVWPWLIGPWLDARMLAKMPAALPQSLLETLNSGCIGQLAEIFDGDAPHRPRGCPAQAWSVAEVLRHCPEANRPHAEACGRPGN